MEEIKKTDNDSLLYFHGKPGPGRAKAYKTPEDLQKKVDEYFQYCEEKKVPPTMSRLALFLGFKTRQSLINYRFGVGYEEYEPILTEAKLRVEAHTEEDLLTKGRVTGQIFSLKNNFENWKDVHTLKAEVEQNQIDYSQLPDEVLHKITEAKRLTNGESKD
jgi:hypothetical protein